MLETQNEKPGEILNEARNQESSRNQILGIPDWITLLILVLQRADAKTGSNTCVKRSQGSKVKRVERGVSACMLSCFSSKQFFATPGTIVRQASLSMGILQARILERVVMPSFRGSSQPRDQTCVSFILCIGRHILYPWHHLGSPSGVRSWSKSDHRWRRKEEKSG